jgi:signal transduction histidine kinase
MLTNAISTDSAGARGAEAAARWAYLRRGWAITSVMILIAFVIVSFGAAAIEGINVLRAYAAGESHWSKAEKSAIIALNAYAASGREQDFAAFRHAVAVTQADRAARESLVARAPDVPRSARGFLDGGNDAADIRGLMAGFVLFHGWKPFAAAVADWRRADSGIDALCAYGATLHGRSLDPAQRAGALARIAQFDVLLARSEGAYARHMGEASRQAMALALLAFLAMGVLACASGVVLAWRVLRNGLGAELLTLGVQKELEVARDEAQTANRMKSSFLASMSHELRTPLNAILGFSDMIGQQVLGPVGNARYTGYARDIHFSGEHLLSIINDLLDHSRIEAGELTIRHEPFDIAATLGAAQLMCGPHAAALNVALRLDVADALPVVTGDELRFKQVLINLICNAVKFSPGGDVHVTARRLAPDMIEVRVRDTGIGMDTAGMAQALRPFGQVDSGLNRKYEGTGLGLPLSKALVELQGGQLTLDSALGQGTCVTVRLPVGTPVACAKAA